MNVYPARDRRSHLLQELSTTQFDPGGTRIALRIAGVRLDLLTRAEGTIQRLRTYFADYLASDGDAVCELALEPITPSGDLPELWVDEDPEFDFRGEYVVQRDFAARRLVSVGDWRARAVALISDESDDSFHNLLRWLMPNLLLTRNAFLMHAAGVVRDGRGYIFFGQSGAGKSTCASLIHASDDEATLLGDDAVIIAMTQAGPVVHAAPLGCGYSRIAPPAISAPLVGLLSLRKDKVEHLTSLTRSEIVAALLGSAMHTSTSDLATERFDLAMRFASLNGAVRALHFTLDPAFWPLVQKEISCRPANPRPQSPRPNIVSPPFEPRG